MEFGDKTVPAWAARLHRPQRVQLPSSKICVSQNRNISDILHTSELARSSEADLRSLQKRRCLVTCSRVLTEQPYSARIERSAVGPAKYFIKSHS